MTGSGTQADPYILTTWQELIASRGQNTYSVWQGGDLDFNTIAPNGFTSDVKIYGAVNFNNATFKNLYIKNGGLYFYNGVGSIQKLNLINCYIIPQYSAITFGTALNNYVNDVKISMLVTPSADDKTAIRCGYSNGYLYFDRCAITVDCITPYSFFLSSSLGDYKDCTFNFNIKQSSTVLSEREMSTFINCKVNGRVLNTSGNSIGLGSSNSGTFFNFDSGTYTASSTVTSVYDSGKCTITGTNVTGCTTAQLGNAEYLRSVGFPIGVD